ncbi:MAG: serine/threonine protein kinase, partial [Myxococcota bacterium]|nr:serine/threonine protein kinase [Myxococcota bacterium]
MADAPLTQAPTEYRDPEETLDGSASNGGEAPFMAGELVAERYRLIRMLGQGGMGVVWVAHSLVLGVDVAIKLMRSGIAKPELAARMAREAQATATLGHPALVRVFDFGVTPKGTPYLVMELAHGETLGALLRREHRLSAVQAVQMLLPVADGLRCAHERGIVHRDIKPENVFLARDALGRIQPKLLDFGIAKLEHQTGDGRLTQMGVVLGSPEFMSPEQARGDQDTDARSDVWSLCVVLYEMLTGTVPFKDENYNALMQSILHEAPVPTTEYATGDRDLWLVIERGLEKSRNTRWRSMTDLGEALALWLYERGVKEDLVGNSLKALWLGGSLSGVSSSALDHSDPPRMATLAERVRAPAGLKFRLLRARRALKTGARVAAVLAVLVVLATLFSNRTSTAEQERALAAAAEPAPTPTAAPL